VVSLPGRGSGYVSADVESMKPSIEMVGEAAFRPETVGGSAFQHDLSRLCGLVAGGKIVRVVSLQTGLHKSWFTRERPGGCEPVRVTIYELGRIVGKIFDEIRGGAVYEVTRGREHRTVGYLYWSADPWLLELLATIPLAYAYRAKSGRMITRDFHPLHVRAEPLPGRKHGRVLVNG
jgi:hypothetical protein